MPIQITLGGSKWVVWLDNNLKVYMTPKHQMGWMLGKDFWKVCAPWVRKRGGKIAKLAPVGQKVLRFPLEEVRR